MKAYDLRLRMTHEEGVFGEAKAAQTVRAPEYRAPVPDLPGCLQRETELTRPTLAEILERSGRLPEVTRNPQQFLEHALAAIQKTVHDLMVQGIEYERIANAEWEMQICFHSLTENVIQNRIGSTRLDAGLAPAHRCR